MAHENIVSMISRLEPVIPLDFSDPVKLSIAISLKRLADVQEHQAISLKRLADAYCLPLPTTPLT